MNLGEIVAYCLERVFLCGDIPVWTVRVQCLWSTRAAFDKEASYAFPLGLRLLSLW